MGVTLDKRHPLSYGVLVDGELVGDYYPRSGNMCFHKFVSEAKQKAVKKELDSLGNPETVTTLPLKTPEFDE